MKQVTRWSPDTCDCTIDYEWDDKASEITRIHTVNKVIKNCSHHQGTDADTYSKVVEENSRKNLTFGILMSIKSDLKPDEYNWSFNEARILKVGVIGTALTAADKNNIRGQCDTKFGAGKVQVI